jgi:hypothetical protein
MPVRNERRPSATRSSRPPSDLTFTAGRHIRERCSSRSRCSENGTKLQVDDAKATSLPIQTCEATGCYASAPIAPDLLAGLKSGKQLKVSFQNLAKETITIPMPLTDFAAAYDKIK